MIKKFLKLVEIQTKVASVIPFLIGTALAVVRFGAFAFLPFLVMLLSLLSFDMMVTALNNYMDYKRAVKKEGYGYEEHNAMGKYGLSEKKVQLVIASLFAFATLMGLYLFYLTDYVVLIIGILSFVVGIFYSFGPIPISRTPLGEVFSGFFMGFIVIFLSVYIHLTDYNFLSIWMVYDRFYFSIKIYELIILFLLSVPTMAGISNIMLANNICDMADDFENKRYTIPIYIGKKYALLLFVGITALPYLTTLLLVVIKVLPLYFLLYFVSLVVVVPNVMVFMRHQVKSRTFVISVKNFLVQNVLYLLLLILLMF